MSLHDLGSGKGSLCMIPEEQATKEKIIMLDFKRIKNLLCLGGHHQESEKTTDSIRENVCKTYS